ncbi:MAG: DNA polymerase Y family protein [Pseudomonadales bacterium]|nr:DNA polymerase Y family protein [Pseudomonadales bacterium]
MLWLALQFPHLGLEVFDEADAGGGGDRDRSGTPAVLLEDNRVLDRNAAAVRAGICPGTTLATAHSICADLKSLQRDEAREQERLQALAQTFYRFSAEVSLEPPDGLLLEISRSLRLFGNVATLVRAVAEACASLGHEVRHRTANTPLAAMVLARAELEQQHLKRVPLAQARLPGAADAVERFANMGIHTLGPLLDLPRAELGQRFGKELLNFLDRLSGRVPDPRLSIRPAPDFRRERHLLEPITDKEALLFPMQRLLDELAHWLVGRQLGAGRLLWRFADHSARGAVILPVHFAGVVQSRRTFLNITRLKLDRMDLPRDILTIGLEAERLKPWQSDSRSLLQLLPTDPEPSGLKAEALAGLLDELSARLGRNACRGISVNDQQVPERAWRPVRPDTGRPRKERPRTERSRTERVTESTSALPLWLFDPPCPVEPEHLTLLRGPERIQTAWWQQAVHRDYYVARHVNGAQCWVFEDAAERWYLHGYFA